MTKNLQVVIWSSRFFWNALDPIVVIFFFKKYFCSENHKFRFNYFWTCDFHYINIFCKKNYNDWIKCISKKFTTTGSTDTCNFFSIFEKNYNDWIKSFSKSRWTGLQCTSFITIYLLPFDSFVSFKGNILKEGPLIFITFFKTPIPRVILQCQAFFWHFSLLILESSTRLETKTFCQVCTLKSKAKVPFINDVTSFL